MARGAFTQFRLVYKCISQALPKSIRIALSGSGIDIIKTQLLWCALYMGLPLKTIQKLQFMQNVTWGHVGSVIPLCQTPAPMAAHLFLSTIYFLPLQLPIA